MNGSEFEYYAGTTSASKCSKAVGKGSVGDYLVRKSGKTSYSLMANDGGKVAIFNIAYKERGDQRYLDLQGRKHGTLDELVHGAMRRHLIGPHSQKMLQLLKPLVLGTKKGKKSVALLHHLYKGSHGGRVIALP